MTLLRTISHPDDVKRLTGHQAELARQRMSSSRRREPADRPEILAIT